MSAAPTPSTPPPPASPEAGGVGTFWPHLRVLGWTALFLLVGMLALAWFWYDSLRAREQANATAIETCRSTGASLRGSEGERKGRRTE